MDLPPRPRLNSKQLQEEYEKLTSPTKYASKLIETNPKQEPEETKRIIVIDTFLPKPKIDITLNKVSGNGNKKSTELLKDPSFLYQIKKTLDIPVAGEDNLKLSAYVIGTSSKFSRIMLPQHLFIQSESGSGKTFVTENVLKLFPKEDVYNVTSLSPKSLRYWNEDLWEKILFVEEWNSLSKESAELLRPKLSGSDKKSVVSDFEDGKRVSKEFGPDGFPVFMAGTTASEIDYELLNRCWVLHTDTSREQTEKILKHQADYATQKHVKNQEFEKLAKEVQDYFKALKSINVINPYSFITPNIFPRNIAMRRHNNKFLNFVNVVAALHQYQRKKDFQNNKESVIANLSDTYLSYRLLEPFLDESFLCLSKEAKAIYKLLDQENKSSDSVCGLVSENDEFKEIIKEPSKKFINELLEELYLKGLAKKEDNLYSLQKKYNNHLENLVISNTDDYSLLNVSEQTIDPITGEKINLYFEKSEPNLVLRVMKDG